MRGISGLNETDKVLVLYSVNATTVKFSIVDEIMRSKAKIVLKEATVGTPNALDFQLITHMLLDYSPDNNIYIVSKDTGYDAVINAMASRGRHNVCRILGISQATRQELPKTPRQEISLPIIPPTPKEQQIDAMATSCNKTDPANANTDMTDIAIPPAAQRETLGAKEPSQSSANPTPQKKATIPQPDNEQAAKKKLRKIATADCDQNINNETLDAIWSALSVSNNKAQFYAFFQKRFGTKEGTKLYKAIRGDFEKMRQIYCNTKKQHHPS